MLEKMDDLTSCSLSYVASILGGKWKPFIVWYLSMAPGKRARYSELRKRIPYDISHKMFSQHLSELEQVGIIERIVVEVKPLRVDYLLTAKGVSFANVLYFIRDWGAAYGGFSAETLQRTKGTMGDGVRTKRNPRLSKQGKAFNSFFRIMPTALRFLSSFSSIVRLPHFQVRSALISALLR